jgi:hypothetical protein
MIYAISQHGPTAVTKEKPWTMVVEHFAISMMAASASCFVSSCCALLDLYGRGDLSAQLLLHHNSLSKDWPLSPVPSWNLSRVAIGGANHAFR